MAGASVVGVMEKGRLDVCSRAESDPKSAPKISRVRFSEARASSSAERGAGTSAMALVVEPGEARRGRRGRRQPSAG